MTRPKGGYYKAELGEPHKFDPTFRGPVHHRGCTDVLCCVIFVIVILGYIVLGTVAWMHGDPRKVVYPTDSYGQFCGQQGTPNANKAILFYFNILQCANPTVLINLQCPTTQLCVSKCPDRFATYIDMQYNYRRNKSYWEYYKQFCKPGFNYPDKPVSQVLRDEDCPSMIVPSRPFLQRCFPDFITRNGTLTVANQTSFKDGHGKIRSVVDLRDAAKAEMDKCSILIGVADLWFMGVFSGLVISMLVSLIFILLLRFTAGILFWMVIFGVIAAVGYGIWHCYWEYSSLKGKPDSDITISDIGFQTDFRVYLQLRQTWLIFMISLAVIEAIIILVLIFLRNRVRIAIALLKEGSKAIGCIMSTLFYPIITFLLLAICIAYWAVTAVFLASSGDAVYKVMSTLPNCKYTNLTCDPETFSQSNVTKLCPGSQCTFAFYGGESLYHRYIFVLQLCNLLVFLWLVNFTIALGQCTLAGAFASYYWALRKPADIPPCPLASSFGRALRYHTGSLAFGALILSIVQFVCWNTVIFGSYMIAHGFFNVYAMCVDTLFLCFLLDLEKNDGSVFRPYYMGSSLRAILNKKNHKRPEEKKKGRQQKK
uniref:Choline transporter-like protein n=1 Tax=Sinocyclocheilus anshuiensis TaxID=1608454 RepID=A0A671QYJ4_9TELE